MRVTRPSGLPLHCRPAIFALALAVILGMPFLAAADDAGDPINGRHIATAWCSNCHTLAGSTQATATGAPAFSAIAADRSITPTSLRVFLQTPHDRMPDLHLSNTETDDLIAYVLLSRGK